MVRDIKRITKSNYQEDHYRFYFYVLLLLLIIENRRFVYIGMLPRLLLINHVVPITSTNVDNDDNDVLHLYPYVRKIYINLCAESFQISTQLKYYILYSCIINFICLWLSVWISKSNRNQIHGHKQFHFTVCRICQKFVQNNKCHHRVSNIIIIYEWRVMHENDITSQSMWRAHWCCPLLEWKWWKSKYAAICSSYTIHYYYCYISYMTSHYLAVLIHYYYEYYYWCVRVIRHMQCRHIFCSITTNKIIIIIHGTKFIWL